MPEITEGVYFIPGQDEFIPDSHVYVIGDPATGDLSVVDAGLPGASAGRLTARLPRWARAPSAPLPAPWRVLIRAP